MIIASAEQQSAIKLMLLLVAVLVGLVLLDLITKLISQTIYYKAKMKDAENHTQYHTARYKLRCLWLRLIPFVNKKNEHKAYLFVYHRKKYYEHYGKNRKYGNDDSLEQNSNEHSHHSSEEHHHHHHHSSEHSHHHSGEHS